jgi:quinoprotein glucose dehydrogenase
MLKATVLVLGVSQAVACDKTPPAARAIEWTSYAGDVAGTHWSLADDVTPETVKGLKRAWIWRTGEVTVTDARTGTQLQPGKFEATPLMVGDTLYLSTPFNRVVALDAISGRELWSYDPNVVRLGAIGEDRYGFVHRGVALWTGDGHRRIFLATRWMLIALDAVTGRPIDRFGDRGIVDLRPGLRWQVNRLHVGNTSPPVVWGNLVIVGSSIADRLIYPRDPPGAVQAFDVRTGRLVWRWDPVPASGDPDRSSWGAGSAEVVGHVNVWAPMSVDVKRGLLYLPVSAPSNDWYGGKRHGRNLYSDSIVCLDAATGKLRWFQQLVHHDLWDYDLPTAPLLATIRRGNTNLDAVFVAGKTGFLYAFDRTSGGPIWALDERPVGGSDVSGESPSPTQPHPSWPLAFTKQGFSRHDVIDFTPSLRRQALALLEGKRLGPLFTPPSLQGTVVLPGWIGGAGWGAAALDPDRRLLFIKGTNLPVLARLSADSSLGYRLRADYNPEAPLVLRLPGWREWYGRSHASVGLPIIKPPYGTLTAINLDSGDTRWQVVIGDSPELRAHPALRDLGLPPLGVAGSPGGVATRGGLVFITGGGNTLFAIDARDGSVKWSGDLGTVGYSNPMTYRARNGTQYIVVATGNRNHASVQAFALPRRFRWRLR